MAGITIDVTQLFTLLMGAGGITFLGAAVKGVQTLRKGAQARDDRTVGGLRASRDEAEQRERNAIRDRDFYHRTLAAVIFQYQRDTGKEPALGEHGLVPPSDRDVDEPPPPARRRARRASA